MAGEKDLGNRKSLALARTQTIERAQGNAVPIEFRTLSIHVTETNRSGKQGTGKAFSKKGGNGKKDADLSSESDFFATVDFHKLAPNEIDLRFNSNATQGLTSSEAKRRLQAHGLNTLQMRKPSYLKKILGYLFGGFCSILWVGVITFFICWQPPLSDPPNVTNLALAILVIAVILLQASFSAFQDFSTARVMSSILDMIPSECHVIRDGVLTKIMASNLVVGDRVHLSLGNKVPADLRILQATSDTRFDRSVLTGESEAIEAHTSMTDDNFLESKNIAFMGTHVVQGSCVGVVVLKGNETLMGRINKLTTGRKAKPTIIQQEITRFVKIIITMTVLLIALILIVWLAWLHRIHPDFMSTATMLVTLMGCVIAFIPEGVPVCVSVTLLMIARRMRDADILPKALSTVETLGCVNVICSDKTGTLTENKMFVTNAAFLDHETTPEEIRSRIEKGTGSNALPQPGDDSMVLSLRQLQLAAQLCNNAKFDAETVDLPLQERTIMGDATDCALLRFSNQCSSDLNMLTNCFERTMEIPFNSRNKWMMAVYQGTVAQPQLIKTLFGSNMMDATKSSPSEKDDMLVLVKGAPDVLLPYCSSYVSATSKTGPQPLTPEWIAELSRIQQAWSRRGQRVLMLCKGRYSPYIANQMMNQGGSSSDSNGTTEELTRQGLQELCILGLVGIMDPPRPEIKDTIQSCRRAGVRFFMVTGDFGMTAAAIATQIGLFSSKREPDTYENIVDPTMGNKIEKSSGSFSGSGNQDELYEVGRPRFNEGTSLVLTGSDITQLSPGEWNLVCAYEEIVFARTSPEQKLRIVAEFQQRDGVVAVTGDGVNDAPALKAADVGIAVVSGSDVAIEAADLILLGGFDAIPAAIRLGRLAFENLQKVIGYLLPAGSWSEVWPVLINTFLCAPLTLSSFLMVIICAGTDSICCLALVFEVEEYNLLALRPRNTKKDHLITMKIYTQSYFFIGTIMSFFCNMLAFLYLKEYTGLGFQDLVFSFGVVDETKLKYGVTAKEFNNVHTNTAQCVCFVALVIMQWGNILSVRNRRMSILQADPFRKERRNLWLFGGILLSFLIAIFVTEVPGIQDVMLTASVPIKYWLLPIPCALFILMADETRKLIVRSYPKSFLARIAW
ncbi:hypothetical protein EMPS_02392 [Entomortierella parvispora]|uniref:Cation-transporting P-type ATPase N-terminal domain-containing protein n=1 Tax=Entomortierella parvispora TaxID=205924 RepID=A0A9P3LTH5_9FUNG|nr:hypothetical protein EMPS_02392 [Entomortierella parvispora]